MTSRSGTTAVTRQIGRYEVRVSSASVEDAWDEFLERVPMGHHAQTSCWGRARALIGWMPSRIIISENGAVVAGAQMVVRPMPFGGNVGFVCRGPAVGTSDPQLVDLTLRETVAMGATRGVQYLVVQPPPGGAWLEPHLTTLGFRHGAFDIDHTSTVVVDMSPSLDELMASLKKYTRKQIREGQRGGITVRRGSESDVGVFNRLKDIHSERLGYPRREAGYYEEMWRALAARHHIELFIAEYEGEPVSAQLAVTFRDTLRHLERPWSGEHGHLRPNELLSWEVFAWAKANGFRFTDLEGVEPELAELKLLGERLPDDPKYSASLFKLKFAPPGKVIFDPPSYDYVYNPVLRVLYRCVPNGVMRSDAMRRILSRLRETGS